MFGRKKRQDAERAFAYQTIDAKFTLVESCLDEIRHGVWFEDGTFPKGRDALEAYLRYLTVTENVVYLTVNSLSPALNQKAQVAASQVLEIVAGPTIPGLGSPAYLASNNTLRELFGTDPFAEDETDLRAADSTLALGFIRTCDPQRFPTLDGLGQQAVVACALAAGWIQSPQRRPLIT